MAQAARTDLCPILPRIDVPALLMAGANDTLTSPELMKQMADQIPDARFRVIPDAAHMINLENTEAFNGELFAFLNELRE